MPPNDQPGQELDIYSEIDKAIRRELNDREFSMVLPKTDNSGNRIDPDEIEDAATRMAERFGGVTVHPSVGGCFVPDEGEHRGELMCEENVILRSVRDSSDGVPFDADERWLRTLAREYGIHLGQFSVMVSEDVTEAHFIDGEYKESLGERVLAENTLSELL